MGIPMGLTLGPAIPRLPNARLDECVGFSALLFEERSILGMTPIETLDP